jgi:ACR3 family arsenite efflux pump ArsB
VGPLILSCLFVVITLAGGMVTRNAMIQKRGGELLRKRLSAQFQQRDHCWLLLTLVITFRFRESDLENPCTSC